MTPAISIVTGTFNRLDSLQRMVDSVRADLAGVLDYEIVVVDGGSTDGTLDWCKQQPDIRLIEHGALLGAIRAFNDGAFAASGQYVVLANDDITFKPLSLITGFRYLEDNPACGAVAYADNRHAHYKLMLDDTYGVQRLQAAPPNVPVVYAQVGMFRRWLGNALGWWGEHDPIMRHAQTYGGDAYLSARVWEFGYSVDAVRACVIQDYIHPDALRQLNDEIEQRSPGIYYRRYPRGVEVSSIPLVPPLDNSTLRILYLPIFEPGWEIQKRGKRGLRDALRDCGYVLEHDYMNHPRSLSALVQAWRPHLMIAQLHDADKITPLMLAEARAANPTMVVVSWCGDVWDGCYTSPAMRALLKHVDLVTGVNVTALETLKADGYHAAYWQIGYEPVDALPDVAAHDVVFIANAYSDERKALGALLSDLPHHVGLYGSGWPDARGMTLYDFTATHAINRRARIAISDNQFPDAYGFVSNRLFETIAAGGALVFQQHVNGLDELTGLKAGVDYVEWTDASELPALIDHWLKDGKGRQKIVRHAQQQAEAHHSFKARVDELFDVLLPSLEEAHELA